VAALPLYDEGALVVHLGPPCRRVPLGPQYDVRGTLVSPDGRWVVTESRRLDGSGVRVKVWEADSGRLVAGLPYPEVVTALGFTPDGRWLRVQGQQDRRRAGDPHRAPAGDGWLQLSQLSGEEEHRLDVASLTASDFRWPHRQAKSDNRQPIERVPLADSVSPDNSLAAVGTSEGMIRLVVPETGKEVARLPSPEDGRLSRSDFSPDGTLLLAGGLEMGGTLYVFNLGLIREQLAELGLDWDPPFKKKEEGRRKEEERPGLSSSFRKVELIDAEAATDAAKMAAYEGRRAVARLFFNPFDADAHYRLGARLLDAGRPASAFAHLTAALAFCPELDAALFPRARAASRLSRWADVVTDTSRCLEKYPFHPEARQLRAEAYRALKRYDEAVADVTALIETYPQRPELYELRATCYEALGKPEQAKADREKAGSQ
jgi:hypothetical protein